MLKASEVKKVWKTTDAREAQELMTILGMSKYKGVKRGEVYGEWNKRHQWTYCIPVGGDDSSIYTAECELIKSCNANVKVTIALH